METITGKSVDKFAGKSVDKFAGKSVYGFATIIAVIIVIIVVIIVANSKGRHEIYEVECQTTLMRQPMPCRCGRQCGCRAGNKGKCRYGGYCPCYNKSLFKTVSKGSFYRGTDRPEHFACHCEKFDGGPSKLHRLLSNKTSMFSSKFAADPAADGPPRAVLIEANLFKNLQGIPTQAIADMATKLEKQYDYAISGALIPEAGGVANDDSVLKFNNFRLHGLEGSYRLVADVLRQFGKRIENAPVKDKEAIMNEMLAWGPLLPARLDDPQFNVFSQYDVQSDQRDKIAAIRQQWDDTFKQPMSDATFIASQKRYANDYKVAAGKLQEFADRVGKAATKDDITAIAREMIAWGPVNK